ncbi:MAG: MoaD/ThiS family protein [Thermoanaerobaculia bacterium]|nr:MoaD/ThiS family protein [Thermoanaerobaculia bacterium]
MIRVVLPYPLARLASCERELELEVEGAVSIGSVLDALETRLPMLRGTIRDPVSGRRRPFLRFYVDSRDLSDAAAEVALPDAVVRGDEPFLVIGAIAGG